MRSAPHQQLMQLASQQQLTQRAPAAQQLQLFIQNGSEAVSGSGNGHSSLTGEDKLHQILRQHHSADIATRILRNCVLHISLSEKNLATLSLRAA